MIKTKAKNLNRLMAWLAFIGIIAIIAVAMISDELANYKITEDYK